MHSPEEMVIGSILVSPAVVYHQAVEQGVSQESFSQPETQLLWQVASKIIKATGSLDRYSILTELKRLKHESSTTLVDSIPTDINPDTALTHIEAIRQGEKKRKLNNLLVRYSQSPDDIDHHISSLASDAMGILHNSTSHRVKSFSELAPVVQSELQAISEGKGDGLVGHTSFVGGVNQWGVAYPRSKVATFAGYQNIGKSTFAIQEMMHQATSNGLNVGLITMEDTGTDVLANGVTSSGAGFLWRYQTGKGDMTAFNYHLKRVKELPIYVIDAPQNIADWEASATLLVAKYKVDFLFTDHLHEITSTHRTHNSDEKYTEIMERITATTKRLGIAHCLYAQYSRDCEKEGRKPKMSDLKGSSKIEQASRRIFQLYLDPETANSHEKMFCLEGSKYSKSGFGDRSDRVVKLRHSKTCDGFVEVG